jgi:hypothetical protein
MIDEAVMAVGGVRDHEGLHGHRVLLHQVADAGVGVDDDLVGEAHVAAPVVLLGGDEFLAVAPVAIVHRHAHRRIGVHHLLGGDDLELVRVGVEAEALRRLADHRVVLVDQLERPVARRRQRLFGTRRRHDVGGARDAHFHLCHRCLEQVGRRLGNEDGFARHVVASSAYCFAHRRAVGDATILRWSIPLKGAPRPSLHVVAPSFLKRSRNTG